MICPSCRSEYRPGFTRCSTCEVDLVEAHDDPAQPGETRFRVPEAPPPLIRSRDLVDYCGFLTLEDAKEAKGTLANEGIASEVVLRDTDEGEEFWLRVPPDRIRQVVQVLGYEVGQGAGTDGDDDASFACSECGATVPGDADTCPKCGASFEE